MSGTVEEKSVKTAEATVSAAGMRIVRLLVGTPPKTVAEMIRATGVTRTAVTEQLNELVAAGFVERTTERLPGRGRPRHLYSATRAALLLLFASNQRLVVPSLWRAIDQVGGEDLTQKVLECASADLAEYYSRRITGTTPEERLQQLCQLLENEGGIVEVQEDENGQLIMRRRSCPFISMFEESRAVCRVDKQVLSLVVGAPVEQKASRHDGAPCCTFELLSANGE